MTQKTTHQIPADNDNSGDQLGFAKMHLKIALTMLLVGLGFSYFSPSYPEENFGVMGISCLITSLFFFYMARDRFGKYRSED